MSWDYVEKNDGFITASKLKCFLRNPLEYKLQYVDKVQLEEEEKRYFIVGNAFDTLVSFGEEAFLEKYYIDEGLLKDELIELAVQKGEIDRKVLKEWKVPELRGYLYSGEEKKVKITPAEGRDIMGMYREIMRQPLADMGSEYEAQKEFVCNYKSLKLKGTLDRFSLEKKMIRDRKTAGRIDFFEYDMEETFDYVMSMAFYFVLVKIELGIDCDVVLDVVNKQKPHQYIAYRLERDRLLSKMATKVIPGLEALIKAYETDTREAKDPLTGIDIPRVEIMKSPYYSLMDASLQKSFLEPM